jgi:hypothetical protein
MNDVLSEEVKAALASEAAEAAAEAAEQVGAMCHVS